MTQENAVAEAVAEQLLQHTKIVKRMQVTTWNDGKSVTSRNYKNDTQDVIDYDQFATWLEDHQDAGKNTYHKKNLIEEMIGCHSDNTKFCGKCLKDMENRLYNVFENKYRNSGGYGRAGSNTHDVLRFMYRVVGEIENVENGQMFLYQKWNECIVYNIYHEPIIVQDKPVYRTEIVNGKKRNTSYQVYVNDVAQYTYAAQGYWMFNINPKATGLNTPKVLQVNP